MRTVGQGALPSGLKGRVYSFEEPAADEGDRMELTARLQTEIENDDRSRSIFFYAFTEEGTLAPHTEASNRPRADAGGGGQPL